MSYGPAASSSKDSQDYIIGKVLYREYLLRLSLMFYYTLIEVFQSLGSSLTSSIRSLQTMSKIFYVLETSGRNICAVL
jgi:hypothetical protein